MDAVLTLMITAGVIAGVVTYTRHAVQRGVEAARDRQQGQLQHRRSGDYPSSCSWCKNTALARKLLVFERIQGSWRARDVIEQLRACPDSEVAELAEALVVDGSRWRRFCTERCTREFLAMEHVQAVDPFVGCDYCSVRFPLALIRCPNCGAATSAS